MLPPSYLGPSRIATATVANCGRLGGNAVLWFCRATPLWHHGQLDRDGSLHVTPAVTDGFVGLHAQGYAFALLLVEICCTISMGATVAPFALLGFLQGWLTFDYVFLVSVTPVAIELAMPQIEPGYQRRWQLQSSGGGLAFSGFAAAHALHFLQVCAYRLV